MDGLAVAPNGPKTSLLLAPLDRDADRALAMVLDLGGSPEAYDLQVEPHAVTLSAPTDAGLFYGATTLWQLMTQHEGRVTSIAVGAVRIHDQPRFG